MALCFCRAGEVPNTGKLRNYGYHNDICIKGGVWKIDLCGEGRGRDPQSEPPIKQGSMSKAAIAAFCLPGDCKTTEFVAGNLNIGTKGNFALKEG